MRFILALILVTNCATKRRQYEGSSPALSNLKRAIKLKTLSDKNARGTLSQPAEQEQLKALQNGASDREVELIGIKYNQGLKPSEVTELNDLRRARLEQKQLDTIDNVPTSNPNFSTYQPAVKPVSQGH